MTPDDSENPRVGRDFQELWNIFGKTVQEDEDAGSLEPQGEIGNEVDIAPVENASTGELITDGNGNSIVAAVARLDVVTLGQVVESKIELKFFSIRPEPGTQEPVPVMYDGTGGEYWGPMIGYHFNTIPGKQVNQASETFCKSPRVASNITATAPDWVVFEVVVAYEVRESGGTHITVYREGFRLQYITQEEINIYSMSGDTYTEVTSHTNGDCLFPDIEISPGTGDTHLVYTDYNINEARDAKVIHRQRENGNDPFGSPTDLSVQDGGDNGWIPRLDIGTVTDPAMFTAEGNVMTVAVVYTRQEMDEDTGDFYGFRPWVYYWRESDGPSFPGNNVFKIGIINWDYEAGAGDPILCGGLPVIDIAPESSLNHDAYICYTQQITTVPNPIRHAVYVVGHVLNDQGQLQAFLFHAVTDIDEEGGVSAVLPTMCMHHAVRHLSITYYYQEQIGVGAWDVRANRVNYMNENDPVFAENIIDTEAFGNFNIAELANFNFGVASGLSSTITQQKPSYFAAWSDAVGMVCEPCHIQATFGFTVPE